MPIIYVNILKMLDLLNIFFGSPNFGYDAKKIDPSEKNKILHLCFRVNMIAAFMAAF